MSMPPVARALISSSFVGSVTSLDRSPDWLKSKNPASPAAKRDAEGFDWGR